MATFDLVRFRDLAFGRKAQPYHPLQNLAEAKKLIAQLPDDEPDHGLAELTHWATTMNATDSFTPGRRARVLMELDTASRPLWRLQASRYLAPGGRPRVGRDGDPKLLRAMFDCVTEMSNGFAIALDAEPGESAWLENNRARITLRNVRALMRRLAIAHMLKHSATSATWERLHRRYMLADQQDYARSVHQVFEGDATKSSVRQEYAHALLLELAGPENLRGREVELAFRIARRAASSVVLETKRTADTWFAVVPLGDSRPVPAERVGKGAATKPLYIGTKNCLVRLRAVLERDMGRDPGDPDTLFGSEFTLGERTTMVKRLIDHWGPNPPQRRAMRVTMATPVRVISGYDRVRGVVPSISRKPGDGATARRKLQLQLDATTKSLKRSALVAAREHPARLVDASSGGLGIAIRRNDATWAVHGALVAVLIEPGKTWVIGVLRRIFAVEDELRLGIQTLSAKPVALTLRADTYGGHENVWSEAMKYEDSFDEHFQTGILLEPQTPPLVAGEILFAPGLASRGTQFDVPLAQGDQRIRVTRVLDGGEHYQRAMFEPLGVVR